MARKKINIIKDLKKLGLIPRTKQYEQMKIFLCCMLVFIVVCLSFYGMYKYPTPTHIYDYYTTPDYRFSDIALSDDCECGNDPSCKPMWWWHDQKNVNEEYRYYV